MDEFALFHLVSQGAVGGSQVRGQVSLHPNCDFFAWVPVGDVRISREQRVATKGTALSFVVGIEDNEDVFQRHHDSERPDDDRQNLHEIIILGRPVQESRRVDVEWTEGMLEVLDLDSGSSPTHLVPMSP